MLRHVLLLLLVMASPAWGQKSREQMEELAGKGMVDENATLHASSEILISAPIAKVWKLLSSIDDWPKWQSAISLAHMSGPLQAGTEFQWSSGAKIKSRLALVVPETDLAWTGTTKGAKAIHVWHLEARGADQTLVSTKESMDGILLKIFYSSKEVEKSQHAWLAALKLASEK